MTQPLQLRQYQIDIAEMATELLIDYKIAYLSMQVRTGKTITAFETAKRFGAKCVLFVTKKKAISSIELDYLSNYKSDFVCYCVNYESIHKLPIVSFDLIILDEAHCLSQFPKPANRTEDIKRLAIGKPIIYLSGTPSPESYSQLYHQFWVSSFSPFEEKNFYQWAKKYVTLGVKYVFNRQLTEYSNARKELIDEKCQNLFISYSQEDAGFQMPVNEHFHHITMSDKTYAIADKLRKEHICKFDGMILEADTEVLLLNKLHQLYSGTVIIASEEKQISAIIDYSKVQYIFSQFKGKKIAIFYKYQSEARMLQQFMNDNDTYFTTDPIEFKDKQIQVFISQIQSGREGINLSCADCLIMFNIDFSAVSYWQARARLQTKDRDNPADVHWIFSKNGIEDRIYKAVSNKKDYTLNYFRRDEKG
jgi:superfamily II DNA or RNA helicase